MDDRQLANLRDLIQPLLAERHMELVELICPPKGGQRLVRCLVDKVGGVTLKQCAEANRRIGEALESSELVEGSYTVEVSSPGLDRPLATKRDFERAIGDELWIAMQPENGRTKEYRGMLLAVQPEAVVLKLAAGNVTVPLAGIRTAKKVTRW